MRYGTNTNLSSLLDQKVDILQLMHDEDSTAYAWTIRKTCPAYVETDIHDNLFSAAGTRARGAKITIRPDSRLTLHEAMRWNGKFLFLTSIELSERRDRQALQAAVCESVTLTARPQDRTGRDTYNRPVAVSVPSFTFPGILTEKYFRNEADDIYRAEVQQRVLVTPKVIVLRAGDLVQKGNETPYTVRQVLDLERVRDRAQLGGIMQSVEISGLKEIQKKLEGYPEAMKKARSEFFEEAGREMLSTVRRRIGGQGYVANVQDRHVGSGRGYAAVRAKAKTELRGYAAGYVTNALEGGHVQTPGRYVPAMGKKLKANRVKGKYMYRKTAAELPQIAERGAQEIEKKAMAYLEGNG